MTHTIENNKNSLRDLLLKVQDQHARAADYLAPTHDLQKITAENGRPQVVIEQRGGEPTRIFDNPLNFPSFSPYITRDVVPDNCPWR